MDKPNFEGLPLKGTPGSASSFGSEHATYRYDENGDLKIKRWPLQQGVVNGRMVAILVDVPANLQDKGYVSPFNPKMSVLGPGNVVTAKSGPDAPPDYVKVNFETHTPGWTSDPNPPKGPIFSSPSAVAQYVASFDANGDPVFGAPPDEHMPSGDATQKLVAAINEAVTDFLAGQK